MAIGRRVWRGDRGAVKESGLKIWEAVPNGGSESAAEDGGGEETLSGKKRGRWLFDESAL
jgi:hypothetical protein